MKDKTDKELDTSSGIINILLGVFLFIAIVFLRSPEVSPMFAVIGVFGALSMSMHGLNKSITASNYNV